MKSTENCYHFKCTPYCFVFARLHFSVYCCAWILRANWNLFTLLHRIALFMRIFVVVSVGVFGKLSKCTLEKCYEMRFWNGCVIFGTISSLSVSLTGFNSMCVCVCECLWMYCIWFLLLCCYCIRSITGYMKVVSLFTVHVSTTKWKIIHLCSLQMSAFFTRINKRSSNWIVLSFFLFLFIAVLVFSIDKYVYSVTATEQIGVA